MSEILDGSQEDFELWCRQNAESLLRIAYRSARNPVTAEDAVQKVLFRFWRHWGTLRLRESVKTIPGYAARAVINQLRSIERSDIRDRERLTEWLRSEAESIDGDMYSEVEWELGIPQILGKLNPTWKLIIQLRYLEKATFSEIADLLGISESTARRYEKLAREEVMKAGQE
ncbi:sigma-70 family RNA polymerase sigma factor [Streptomyces sp. NPDC088194]|uniref:RNA polymerase sigma factor n=1 Tax=Streptomyces sp. NPDC088194 TaxID=3154931 RepID=UPI00344C1AC1